MKDPSLTTRRKKLKIKLVVSYNGEFRRLPSSGKLRYAGGEAKIISVDRHITLSSLEAKIADLFVVHNDAVSLVPFSLSYLHHLADEDERLVGRIDSDDDVRRMISEFEKLEAIGKRCRLWVFVCTDDKNSNKSFHIFRDDDNGYDKKRVLDANRENLITQLSKSEKDRKFGDGLLRKTKQQLVTKQSDKTSGLYDDAFEINGTKSDGPVIDFRSECESGLSTESENSALDSEWHRVNMLDYEYRKINAVQSEKFGEVLHVPVSNSRPLNAKDGNLHVGLGGPMMGLLGQTRLNLCAGSVHYAKPSSNSNMNSRTCDFNDKYDLQSVELACLSNMNRENILPSSVNCDMVRNGFANCSRSNQLVGVANRTSSLYGTKKAWVGFKSGICSHRFGSTEKRNLQICPYHVRNRGNVNEMGNHHNFRLDRRPWPDRVHPGHGLSSSIPKPGEATTLNSKLLDVKADYQTFSSNWNATHTLQDGIVPLVDISLHNLSLSSKRVELPVLLPARSDISVALQMPESKHYHGIDEDHFISGFQFEKSSIDASESSPRCDAKTEKHNHTDEEDQHRHLPHISIGKKDEDTDGTISSKANGRTSTKIAAFYNHLATGALQTIKNSDLEYIKELGSGACGTVYHGKWKGSDVAIKKIKPHCFTEGIKEEDRLVADFWKEAHILGQLHHPNVVALYGVVTDGPVNNLATVTEYMVNGSLKQVLQRKDRTIDRRKRLIIARDAAFGMEYLHGKNIVHFDLKSHNLLVNMRDSQRPVCKIGDLGLSKIKQRTLISGGVRGTIPWMAPELFSAESMVTEKVDVFSFGIVMWELLTGEEPYANLRSEEIIAGIIKGSLRPETPSWCDPAWRSLMERCWSSDPDNRPSFLEVAKELRAMAVAANIK